MNVRKKKVEDALSKLFSSKSKSEAPNVPSEEPVHEASLPKQGNQSAKSSRRAKPPIAQPNPPSEEQTATTESSSAKSQPSEAGQAQASEMSVVMPKAEPLPPTSQIAPSAIPATSTLMSGIEADSTPSIPSAPSSLSRQKPSGDGSASTAESEVRLPHETAGEQITQLVIFTLAGEFFGLPIEQVESIIKPQTITVVPHARPYVVGVTNLRGTVLPVIDLRRRFQLPHGEESEDQRIMVVLFHEEKIGLQVDSVTQVLRVPLSAIEPPPPLVTAFVHSALMTGIAKVDERLVILLDLEKVLLRGDGH